MSLFIILKPTTEMPEHGQ